MGLNLLSLTGHRYFGLRYESKSFEDSVILVMTPTDTPQVGRSVVGD